MRVRVVVAEDDTRQAELIRRYFERESYAVTVVHDGRAAIEVSRQVHPDLVVLDWMLPRLDGIEVCRVLRDESDVAILMLTARSTEDDLLHGLDVGADDYLTKPFSPRELMARARTLVRRAQRTHTVRAIRIGPLTIDRDRHEVTRAGQPIECTPAEFAILAEMATRPGRAYTRKSLLDAAFGRGHGVLDRTIDVHMLNLRRKIEIDPSHPAHLLTVYGVGYKLADTPAAGRDDQ
jgi:DNA-binding response OmpR family regulator